MYECAQTLTFYGNSHYLLDDPRYNYMLSWGFINTKPGVYFSSVNSIIPQLNVFAVKYRLNFV